MLSEEEEQQANNFPLIMSYLKDKIISEIIHHIYTTKDKEAHNKHFFPIIAKNAFTQHALIKLLNNRKARDSF